jgi:hypothetical protein
MNVTDLTNAIISGINDGGEAFLEGTLAAVLPIVWLAILGLQLGRPYILDMIDRFTLRLGADLLWLIYVALRDLMIVSGVVMSFMFFFPDVVTGTNLPITGGLAAATLFAILLIKLMGDPDHDPRLFKITTWLLGLGALFYFVPYILGVQAAGIATGQLADISNAMVSATNPNWALAFAYISIALLAIMGAIAAIYAIRTGGRPESSTEPTQAPAA